MGNLCSIYHAHFDVLAALTNNNHNKAVLLDKCLFWWQISKFTLGDQKIWFTRPIKTMAEELKVSERSINRYLAEFEQAGFIARTIKLCAKKRLYIRITEKLLNLLPSRNSVPDAKPSPEDTATAPQAAPFLPPPVVIDNDNLSPSTIKDLNHNSVNNTVSGSGVVDNAKNTPTPSATPLYPLYPIEKLIGERLDDCLKQYVKGMLYNLEKQHGIKTSAPEQLFAEVAFSLLNKEQFVGVSDLKHRLQIIAKLMREKRWRTPKGFYNHADYGRYFKKDEEGGTPHKGNSTNSSEPSKWELKRLLADKKARETALASEIIGEEKLLSRHQVQLERGFTHVQAVIDIGMNKIASLMEEKTMLSDDIAALEHTLNTTFMQKAHAGREALQDELVRLEQASSELQQRITEAFEAFGGLPCSTEAEKKAFDAHDAHYQALFDEKRQVDKAILAIEEQLYRSKAA